MRVRLIPDGQVIRRFEAYDLWNFQSTYYSTKAEALKRAALHYHFSIKRYERDCRGKTHAARMLRLVTQELEIEVAISKMIEPKRESHETIEAAHMVRR